MGKKISVIIPVYNAAFYLQRCFDSILAETYENYEVIIVDDASTDESPSIIESYVSRYQQFSSYRLKKNSGPGCARNAGIKYATGDYIVFIDADDYIQPKYFSLLNEHNEDVVLLDYTRITPKKRSKSYSLSHVRNMTKDEVLKYHIAGILPWAVWQKAVKRQLITERNLKLAPYYNGEEILFTFSVMLFAKTYGYLASPVYVRELHYGGLSDRNDIYGCRESILEMRRSLYEQKIYEEYGGVINVALIHNFISGLYTYAWKYQFKKYRERTKIVMEILLDDIDHGKPVEYRYMQRKVRYIWSIARMKCYLLIFLMGRVYRRYFK